MVWSPINRAKATPTITPHDSPGGVASVPPKPAFSSVQAGRGLAASAVVLFHVGEIMRLPKYWNSGLYHRIFWFGSYGVHFFFVLSGFIILWAHHGDIGKSRRVGSYAFKRIARIYPPYWIASILILIVSSAHHPSMGEAPGSSLSLVESFVLIGRHDLSILPVGWTLFHEMLFYILFGAVILTKRIGYLLLGAWFLACTIGLAPDHYWTSRINVLFLVGMSAFWLIRNGRIPMPGVAVLIGVVMFVGNVSITSNDNHLIVLYGVSAWLLLVGGIELERSGTVRIPGVLVFLGDASYSIYLAHFAVISAGAKLLRMGRVDVLTAGPVLFAMGVGGGILFHLLIEKPLSRVLRRKARPMAQAD